MPTFFFPLNVITQIFEDDGALSEGLNFHEISRFDFKDERRSLAVRVNAEEILKDTDALDLASRIAPLDFETGEIVLAIEPPRNNAKQWRQAVPVKIHFLKWQHLAGYSQAFVPALGIGVLSKETNNFEQKIEQEIRAALARTGAAKSLKSLRMLERIREIRIEKSELAVEIKTLKQRAIDENKPAEEKSVLAAVATKLDDKNLLPAFEMQTTVELLAEALLTKQLQSVLLVGANGVGKTAVFQELVRQREKYGFRETHFFATSGAQLVAGQTGFGMWQERCQKLVAEIKKQSAILHLGNLVELLEVGKSNSNSQGIASFFRPKIARGELQIVVECTPEELTIIEKNDPSLLAAFAQISVLEPDRATGLEILQQVAAAANASSGLKIAPEAIKTLDAVHRRYATYSAFPGRPVRFLRNLLANENDSASLISPAAVLKAFSTETGLPLFLLSDEEQLDLSQTEKWFEQKVLGQTEAIKLIIDLIATVKARLTRPRQPIASLLFIGATGVGKTELTKALAEFFFGTRGRLARFDMSEFSTPSAVARLIGGFGDAEEGLLTAKMREQPFSVLLFDELEKAHPQFFDLLLQVLGEGRLTDQKGRVADFTNSIIVMTSNLGAETFGRGRSGFLSNAREKQAAFKHFTDAVRGFLRPEIYNRIDRIAPFAPLDEKTAETITELEIEKIKLREGLKFRQIKLNIEPKVIQLLAHKGYDVRYGARPLRRAIEQNLLAPLAARLNERSPNEKLIITVGWQDKESNVSEKSETLKENASLSTNSPLLSFEVNAANVLQKKRITANYILATLANRAAELRRKTQKLIASHHLIELADEQFQLLKMGESSKRKKWLSPEALARLERLPKIQNFLVLSKNFGADAAHLEERVLLDIYGRAETVNEKFADELTINELRWQKILFDLLNLKTEKPNEVSMTIHSENAAALFRLVRCYLQCIESASSEATEIYCLSTIEQPREAPLERPLYGRKVWQIAVTEPEKYFAQTRGEIIETSLRITGEQSKLRFAPESGVHYFVTGNKTERVAVGTGDFKIKGSQPSEKFAARGSLDDSFYKRRFYNAETGIVDDKTLDKKYEFDGRNVAQTVFEAIEENLYRTANELLS